MDPNAHWVDQCEDVNNLDLWRGNFTSVAGRYRGSATSIVSVAGWNGDPEPDHSDGYAEITVETFAVATSEVGVALRIQTATAHYVCITTQSGTANIYKFTGSFSSLVTASITVPAVPFTIRGDINDTVIRMWVNDLLVLSVSDSTFTGPGQCGIYEFPVTAVGNVEIGRWETGPLRGPPTRRGSM